MTITIGGPTNASEGPSGRRVYTWLGIKYPSVTSIPRMAGMSERLHRWFIGNLIDHVLGNASAISLRTATGDEREVKILRSELWRAVEGNQNGRIVGLAVHRAAAQGLDPDSVHRDIAPKLRQYLDWRAASGVTVLASEFQVWNLSEGYAGTADLLVRFPDQSIWLVDLKTGRGLYGESGLQLMAYLMAEFVGSDDVVDERLTDLLHQAQGTAILHLRDRDWEFVTLKPDPATWTAYRGLIRYVGWMQANADLEGVMAAKRYSDGRSTEVGA
jgi:hypothetical protein